MMFLNMSISDATDFFEHIPKIFRKLKTIRDVGLGYLTLRTTKHNTYLVVKLRE